MRQQATDDKQKHAEALAAAGGGPTPGPLWTRRSRASSGTRSIWSARRR